MCHTTKSHWYFTSVCDKNNQKQVRENTDISNSLCPRYCSKFHCLHYLQRTRGIFLINWLTLLITLGLVIQILRHKNECLHFDRQWLIPYCLAVARHYREVCRKAPRVHGIKPETQAFLGPAFALHATISPVKTGVFYSNFFCNYYQIAVTLKSKIS